MATFVLVHGAWHGGWCWKQVSPLLRDAGHEVYAPTLTGLGERVHLASPAVDFETHVTDIVNLLLYEDLSNVLLVGHSYGGMVTGTVAHRTPERIGHLIYLDALLPEDGKSVADLFIDRGMREPVEVIWEQLAMHGPNWNQPPAAPDSPTLGITNAADIKWVAERLAPQPIWTVLRHARLDNPAADVLPRTFISCTDRLPGLVTQMAADVRDSAGWSYRELDACHDAMITEPDRLASLLLDVAFEEIKLPR